MLLWPMPASDLSQHLSPDPASCPVRPQKLQATEATELSRWLRSSRWGFPSSSEPVAPRTAPSRSRERELLFYSVPRLEPHPCYIISSNPITSQGGETNSPTLQNKETKAQRGQTTGPRCTAERKAGAGTRGFPSVQSLPSLVLWLPVGQLSSLGLRFLPLGTCRAALLPQV